MTIDEAVTKLKGPKGTEVTVTLVRPGLDEPFDLTITRAEIPQNTVPYAYMLDDRTGYMLIRDFSRSTGSEVAQALHGLEDQGMERLILDLRGNAGGLLDQAIEVADQFVPEKSKIVETRGRVRSSDNAYYSSGVYDELGMPLVVLVNGGSASAAEILAGAIQDHDVGLIVGEPTWGKGLVQTVYTLPYGAGLALTTARYYTPSGRLIQRDYSSYWDYYTQYDPSLTAEALELESEENSEAFHTDLGRKVFGGGGIAPDVQVAPIELSGFVQRLLGRSAFFRFAVDYQNRHPVASIDWRPEDGTLEAFREWLAKADLGSTDELDEAFSAPEARAYFASRIRSEIFTSALGLEAGHRALAETDNQIQRALELFSEAEKLLDKRVAIERPPAEVASAGVGR
jgi:carboxyl-terminal processing protease